MKSFGICVAAVALGVAVWAPAEAGTIASGGFPAAGDPWSSATNGTGTIPMGGRSGFMWTKGDYVALQASAKTPTGGVATSGTDTFNILNVLGQDLTVDLLVDGHDVGSFTIPQCGECFASQTYTANFNFAPLVIPAGPLSVSWVLQNTIGGGGGSIAWEDGGQGALFGTVGVPEPSSWSIALAGLLGLGGLFFAKRRVRIS